MTQNFEYCGQNDINDNIITLINEHCDTSKDIIIGFGCEHIELAERISSETPCVFICFSDNAALSKEYRKIGAEAYNFILNDDNYNVEYIASVLNKRTVSAVIAADFLEFETSVEKTLQFIHSLSVKFAAPLILSAPNIAYDGVVLKLMEGIFEQPNSGISDKTQLSFFTDKSLTKLLCDAGFSQIGACDKDTICRKYEGDILLSQATSIAQKLTEIRSEAEPFHSVERFVRIYDPFYTDSKEMSLTDTKESCEENQPFLSVVIRTQGRRPTELAETLLSLTAQSFENFEVLIMMHKTNPQQQETIKKLVNELPCFIKEKITLHNVDHGNRATPLNEGALASKGNYISFLDDDDYVFDNWAETFYELSKENNGRLLHAYATRQMWDIISDANSLNNNATYSVGQFYDLYCRDFDFILQISENKCPLMSIAFPAELFFSMNRRFDETLDTTEDWDFIMRNVFTCGIADSSEVTAVYRGWISSESSATIHTQEEWDRNRNRIIDKLDDMCLLLPKKTAKKLLYYSDLAIKQKELENIEKSLTWRVVSKIRGIVHLILK